MPVRHDFEPGEFCWIDLAAHDQESALAWYGDLFGWTHVQAETPGDGPRYVFFLQDGAAVGGCGRMSDEMQGMGIPPIWNSYVATENCAATEARVRELGGRVTAPTTDVPGHGKLAFFTDPEGASFAAWESTGTDSQGVRVDEPSGAAWFELATRDEAAAEAFYGALFGWRFEPVSLDGMELTVIRNGARVIGGTRPMVGARWKGVRSCWMLSFATEDCAELGARAKRLGGKVLIGATTTPLGTFSLLQDPQGGAFAAVEGLNRPS